MSMESEKNESKNNESENDVQCSAPENICINPLKLDQKNHKFDARNFFESYRFALSGIVLIIRNERNFRIQLCMTVIIVIFGIMLDITHFDWVALAMVTALVLISEAFNSVIEAVCDTVSQEYRVNIRYAKDVSAGAVLVSSSVSAVTGIIIFYPYLWNIVENILNR